MEAENKSGYMMLSFLALPGPVSSASGSGDSTELQIEKLTDIRGTFAAFGLLPAGTKLPQAIKLSEYDFFYSFGPFFNVTVSDAPDGSSTSYSLGVAMADVPDSLDVDRLFAAFLTNCTYNRIFTPDEALALVNLVYRNEVNGGDSTHGTVKQGNYTYSFSQSHTDSERFFTVTVSN